MKPVEMAREAREALKTFAGPLVLICVWCIIYCVMFVCSLLILPFVPFYLAFVWSRDSLCGGLDFIEEMMKVLRK